MGIGEIFALASAATWSVAVILFKRSGETMPPFPLNLFKNTFTLVLMVPTLVLVEGWALPDLPNGDLGLLLVSGVIGVAVADTLYFQALNAMGAGRTGIVSSLYSPSVIILSFLFLGERLNLPQWLGFGLVLLGVVLVSYRQQLREISPQDLRRGVALAALAVVLMAIGVVMIKRILEQQPLLWVVQMRLVGGVGGMLLVMMLRRRTALVWSQLRAPHNWPQIVIASLFGTYLALMLWLAGYKYTLASIASVLNETASIFIVLMAWLLLREPLTKKIVAGATLTFTGVLLMTTT
jgi:drug/metabolite transporter (DMT)-like permease